MTFTAFLLSSGATTKLVAASSSTSVTATQVCTGGEQGMFISNPTTVPVYLAVGTSAVSAAQPTTAQAAAGLCLPSGVARPFSCPGTNSGWLSAVTSAGAAAPGVLATPGFYGS
jgi:hypothetical protein